MKKKCDMTLSEGFKASEKQTQNKSSEKTLIEKALKTVRRHALFSFGDNVLSCLSGGADSVALLLFLKDNAKNLGITFAACHLNHMLRAREAERDEDFCRALCLRLEIPFFSCRKDVKAAAEKKRISLEEAGREARYCFFNDLANEHGFNKIAVAHNLQDLAETMLFNMARGSSPAGLCSLRPVRGNVVRPLLFCDRPEIERYLAEKKQEYLIDSTNSDEKFSRNRLRLRAIPALRETNTAAMKHFAELSELIAEDESFLEGQARSLLASAQTKGGHKTAVLSDAPEPLKRRAAAIWLHEHGFRVSLKAVSGLCSMIEKGKGSFSAGGGTAFVRDEILSDSEMKTNQKNFKKTLFEGKNLIPDGEIIVSFVDGRENLCNNNKSVFEGGFISVLDTAAVHGKISARSRLPDDRIRPHGRGLTKTVKKLLSESGLPKSVQRSIPVLEDEKGILTVPGLAVRQDAVAGSETRKALILCFCAFENDI